MANVDDTLPEWSSTSANNKPTGATTIGTSLDDDLREIEGVVVRWLSHKGSDIASAGTTDLGAVEGLMHDITGTATITGFGTIRSGIWKLVKFEGAALLTHNATSLILPGAQNIVTADGDVGIFMSEGSGNWRCLHFMKANGSHLGPVSGTEVASTSGTSVAFTGIPSWAKKITIQLVGVSTSGTDSIYIQIGDSGGLEPTGYLSVCTTAAGDGAGTIGFVINNAVQADAVLHGQVILTLEDSVGFTWVASGALADSQNTIFFTSAGSKSLSAALDRLSLVTHNGTDTFDAGSVNILYE